MKREVQSDDSGPDNKRNRRNDDIVRLLIPSRIAGAIIGKGGQHIQKMRSQYKATVSVDDCQGPERTILISSDMESACSIIAEMLKYFEEKDDEVDVRMLIHQSLAGCVIGKAGAKIKEIRDKIGCRILKVFSNVAPQSTDRIVQIIGKQEQCVNAVREVLNLTRDTPLKGAVHNYDPINFDDVYADEYGGYGGVQNGGGGGSGGGGGGATGGGNFRGGDRQSRFDRGRDTNRFGSGDRGGRRDDRSRSGGRRDREYINPWANDSNSGGGAGPGSMGGGAGFGSGGGAGFGGGTGGGFGGGNGGGFNSGGGGGGGFGGFGSSGGATGGFSGGAGGGAGGFGGGSFGGGGAGGFGGGAQGGNFGSGGGFGAGNLGGNMGNGMGGGLGGGSMGGGGNMGGSGGGFGGGGGMNGQNDGKNSTQVTIPKDLAGAIIGKAGGRIKRIRQESGAYITIDEPLPGSNDRIITISGNQKQIQMAQYLLQQSVHENRRKF